MTFLRADLNVAALTGTAGDPLRLVDLGVADLGFTVISTFLGLSGTSVFSFLGLPVLGVADLLPPGDPGDVTLFGLAGACAVVALGLVDCGGVSSA